MRKLALGTAQAMLKQYKVPMPNPNLSDAEVSEYIKYFHWADENVRPAKKP